MPGLSARRSGTLLVATGAALGLVHLRSASRLWETPTLLAVEALLPLGLALVVAGVGVVLRGGGFDLAELGGRVLGWTAIGMVVLAAATGWLFVHAAVAGRSIPIARQVMINAVTLGALVGLVVGIYDARGQRQRARANRLTRINETLRVATRAVVDASDREELEQAVCDRLTQSAIYDRAWLGRYDSDASSIRPVAWTGHDDDYIASLTVSVDPDDPLGQGPGGEAIRTGEIQPVQDVSAEPALEPWWEMLAQRGVESMAVVPLVGADRVYGCLSVYANRANVFDAPEREALSELGESIGNAIDSIRAREQLARRERELARQNDQLDAFASVVSHDLRNPLNVAQGNVELVRAERDDDRLERAADAFERMDELIDNLLTLAREGQAVNEFRPVDLRTVAENAWATTDTGTANLRFEGDLGHVQGDDRRLAQVFENLFRNCVEHGLGAEKQEADGDDGPGITRGTGTTGERNSPARDAKDPEPTDSLTVTVGRTDDGFYVADDGRGIPEDERERVFETGYSTDPSGTGFGLNIVRSIAEAHDWSVAVTESAAGGARFEFAGVEAADGG